MKVKFIPKPRDTHSPWKEFGCDDPAEYELWVPHICGICCLKMIIDTLSLTDNVSLYSLTMQCFELGGFRCMSDGSIKGVFHRPLLRVAQDFGLNGEVFGNLDSSTIQSHLLTKRFVILSVDLERAGTSKNGSHLILIHSWAAEKKQLIFHDCSSVLGQPGSNLHIGSSQLDQFSNRKGLILWKA